MRGLPIHDEWPAPIARGLFIDEERDPARARLRGGRDRASGRILFPCPDGDRHEPVALAREGRLWSFTVQRFRPKSPPYDGPADFTPYAVGYVELAEQVIVESRLTGVAFDALRIGMALRLTTEPFTMGDGSIRTGFAFTPIKDAAE